MTGSPHLPDKVLVANRGEIAVRIITTLQRLGIGSVAVYHAVDAGSRAVELADEAVELPGNPPVSAYLNVEAIIDACHRSGAKAIHPGFGFLSERASFAEAVRDAGLIFVGPGTDAIRAMGDKIESKVLAARAGVPTVPGSTGAVDSVDAAIAVGEEIGYPLLLKASAGGGGKGMRVVNTADECREAFERATSEARSAFGDGRLLIERYIGRPRHIEVQVLGDHHGNVIHLGERECSIQRRFQKVIEEAPSPAVDDDLRAEIGARAVALAQAVGYYSAGTVEMILDENRNAYFLEMNTRLQVEHPVTEAVTGIDIVEEQLKIAVGESLSIAQADVKIRGSAIECRIYAEDADAGFLPATGRLHVVRFPSGDGVRVDHGVTEGHDITSAFDPMIAKVITHAPTRREAINRMHAVLNETVLLGTTTNREYLARVVATTAFGDGQLHTGFLDEHADELVRPNPTRSQENFVLAVGALHSSRFDRRHQLLEPHAGMAGWTSA